MCSFPSYRVGDEYVRGREGVGDYGEIDEEFQPNGRDVSLFFFHRRENKLMKREFGTREILKKTSRIFSTFARRYLFDSRAKQIEIKRGGDTISTSPRDSIEYS